MKDGEFSMIIVTALNKLKDQIMSNISQPVAHSVVIESPKVVDNQDEQVESIVQDNVIFAEDTRPMSRRASLQSISGNFNTVDYNQNDDTENDQRDFNDYCEFLIEDSLAQVINYDVHESMHTYFIFYLHVYRLDCRCS